MKTVARVISREIFSLTTLLFVVMPFVMQMSGSGSYQANMQSMVRALPLQEIQSRISYHAHAGAFALRSQIPSISGNGVPYTSHSGPIFLP
jgi:hypothetical protein